LLAKEIVADENVNFTLIKDLRSAGHAVYSIIEKASGIDDEAVISIVKKRNAILRREDSDFGEWVFAHGIQHICNIFMHYHHSDVAIIPKNLLSLLQSKEHTFSDNFFVLTSKKLRVRHI